MSSDRADHWLLERRATLLRVGVICLACCAMTAVLGSLITSDPGSSNFVPSVPQLFRSYLVAYLFCLCLALGALVAHMLHALTGGMWGVVLRPFLESAIQTIPLLALLFVPLCFGLGELYPWARWHADEIAGSVHLEQKARYLNVPFFSVRAVFYLAVRSLLAWRLLRPYNTHDAEHLRGRRNFSAFGLIAFTLTCTFASVDWVMSLEPLWYSSIFGMIFAALQVLGGFALALVFLTALAEREPVREFATPDRLHDLGKLLLAFVMLWAYVAFSQFLLIWAGNLPEEITYYLKRFDGGWVYLALALVFFKFVAPFVMLLSRQTKRTSPALGKVALLLVVMTYFDLYWMVVPAFFPYQGLRLHWMSLLMWAGLASVLASIYMRNLARRLEEFEVDEPSAELMPDD
ncbi:MAG: hypothetical protein AB7K24_21815 [Gemmataceae bacterium]